MMMKISVVKFLTTDNRTLDSFWKRWRREYLLELREAHRHYRSSGTPQIAVGDVVVVYSDNQPRSRWKLGLVERVEIGADGEVRAASVRVTSKEKSKTLCRPTQHLYPLEVRYSQEEDAVGERSLDPEGDAIEERLLDPENDSEHAEPQTEASIPKRPRRSAAARARDRIYAQALSESQV